MKREQLGSRLDLLCFLPDALSDAEMFGNFRGCAGKTAAEVLCWYI